MTQFQRGHAAAQACASHHAVAILCANQAWAYATMGRADQALRLLDHSRSAFAAADRTHTPGWAAFFDDTALSAMLGVVHTELVQTVHPRHTNAAIPALAHAATGYPDDMARSKTFTLIALATCSTATPTTPPPSAPRPSSWPPRSPQPAPPTGCAHSNTRPTNAATTRTYTAA